MTNTPIEVEQITTEQSLAATTTPDIDRRPLHGVELPVSNSGRGSDPIDIQPDHHGLCIIRERASATGPI